MIETLPAEVVQETTAVEQRAAGIVILCEEQYVEAAAFLGEVDKTAKRIEALRVSLTRPLDDSKKRIMDLFRGPLDRLVQAKSATKESMLAFRREQEEAARLVREAQERERARLVREAEAVRVEAARVARQAEEAAREQARKDREAEAARLAAIEAEMDRGNILEAEDAAAENVRLVAEATARAEAEEQARWEAEAIADVVAIVPPLPPPPEPVRAQGVAVRKIWRFRVVAPDLVPRAFLQVDEKLLAEMATNLKGEASVPGVEFYFEETIARTGR
jgi:hypothetical protein